MRNIILIITLLVITYTFFGTKREPNTNELAYTWAAVASQSVEPCKKIGAASINTYSFNPANKKAVSLRSECYRSVAVTTGNEELCSYAVPVSRLRSLLWDGSGYNSELCLTQVKKKQSLSSPSLTSDLATKLMSSLYSDDAIYQDCNHHFSTQRANNNILKNTFQKNYDQCVTRRTRSTNRMMPLGGLETSRINKPSYSTGDSEPSFKTKERCKDTLMRTIVKDYYFGKPANRYPRNREYAHCENYCAVIEFDGYCKKPDREIPYEIYKKFLSSQAHNGKLIHKLEQMPNYYLW